jgi:hypothetical protein
MRTNMNTQQIRVSDGRDSVEDIRHRLFSFTEVLEVFATGRSDVLVVVHTGRPRVGKWLAALRAVGYRTPPRRSATALITASAGFREADLALGVRDCRSDRDQADCATGCAATDRVRQRASLGRDKQVTGARAGGAEGAGANA